MPFQHKLMPHGRMDYFWELDVLHVYINESINYEGAFLMCNTLQNTILSDAPKAWKRLVVLSECAFCTHDAIGFTESLNRFAAEHGCQAVAYVLKHPIQMMNFDKKHTNNPRVSFFDDIKYAQQWLATF